MQRFKYYAVGVFAMFCADTLEGKLGFDVAAIFLGVASVAVAIIERLDR